METDFSDEFSFIKSNRDAAKQEVSNGPNSKIMLGKLNRSTNAENQGVLMLDRLAQIKALIEAKKDVEKKIDQMFSEDRKAFDSAIQNMSQIDFPKLVILLTDTLHMSIQGRQAYSSEDSSHIHELMFALDKFRDASTSDGALGPFVEEHGETDLEQPQEKIKAVEQNVEKRLA